MAAAAPTLDARSTPVGVAGLDDPFALHLPVQRRATAPSDEAVHEAAAHGTRGAASELPHLAAIQRSFGHHDVSGVQAHLGADATAGARAMGAEAFATGNHVAFAGAPTLHTAAHEAAHVVQQRAGVHRKGEVGHAGDLWERHADAVADRVVAGASAVELLDQVRGTSGASGSAVQRKVMTSGGWWDTTEYGEAHLRGDKDLGDVGADIRLEFRPNHIVDSPAIGLMQVVSSELNGGVVTHVTNPSVEGGDHAGARMDNADSALSPLYAEDTELLDVERRDSVSMTNKEREALGAQKRNRDLDRVPVSRVAGGHGRATADEVAPAWLADHPRMLAALGVSASMRFETTAMSLAGEQAQVYYGSVSWGWSKDAGSREVRLEPLTVVNVGAPSDMFRAAAEVWNRPENRAPLGDPRLKVPMPEVASLTGEEAKDPEQIKGRIRALTDKHPFFTGWFSAATAQINVDKRNDKFQLLFLDLLLKKLEAEGDKGEVGDKEK